MATTKINIKVGDIVKSYRYKGYWKVLEIRKEKNKYNPNHEDIFYKLEKHLWKKWNGIFEVKKKSIKEFNEYSLSKVTEDDIQRELDKAVDDYEKIFKLLKDNGHTKKESLQYPTLSIPITLTPYNS